MTIKERMIMAIRRGVEKAAFDMEAHAARICPVDTGRLRASIKVRIEGDSIIIGAYTEYAEYIEFGTHKMRAQPYIRPAIHAGVKRYIQKRIIAEVRKIK